MWPGRRNEVNPFMSFIYNECAAEPVIDIIAAIREGEKEQSKTEKEGESIEHLQKPLDHARTRLIRAR